MIFLKIVVGIAGVLLAVAFFFSFVFMLITWSCSRPPRMGDVVLRMLPIGGVSAVALWWVFR